MNNFSRYLIHNIPFYCLVLFFLILQYYRINYLAPPPEYIWDNVFLWDWARNFGNLNFSTFVSDSHHQLRWGNWGFAALLIKLFSDEVFYYYLSTIIPSSIAIVIFVHFAWRYVGFVGALVFLTFWYYDALLFRATFQLLPSGAALLPVAIMLVLCARVVEVQKVTIPSLIMISVTMFWLYGTKETHLAYLPAVLWLLYCFSNFRYVCILLGIMAVGYAAETLFFLAINSEVSVFGRIHMIVDGGQHVKIMTESERYVGQQTQYFDSGITMRWATSSGLTPVTVFLAFVFSLLTLANTHGKSPLRWDTNKLLSVLTISFFICTTFFIISIVPIRLGHGLVPRYVTTMLPLAYLLIIGFTAQQLARTPARYKVMMIMLVPFLIAPSIDRYKQYSSLSISEVSRRYNGFSDELAKYDCVRSKQKSIVMNQLDLVPQDRRPPSALHMIGNDENTIYRAPWYIAKADLSTLCQRMYTISRHTTMRY